MLLRRNMRMILIFGGDDDEIVGRAASLEKNGEKLCWFLSWIFYSISVPNVLSCSVLDMPSSS